MQGAVFSWVVNRWSKNRPRKAGQVSARMEMLGDGPQKLRPRRPGKGAGRYGMTGSGAQAVRLGAPRIALNG